MVKIEDVRPNLKLKVDGLYNQYTGLGGSRDKNFNTTFQKNTDLVRTELDWIYRYDWLARKVTDQIVEDALRETIDFKIDPKYLEPLETELERLRFYQKLKEALKLSRLYGGSAIILGAATDEDLSEPITIEKVDRIESINVLDRYKFNVSDSHLNKNLFTEDYNLPDYYPLNGDVELEENNQRILHKSRLIRFDGNFLPWNQFEANGYWHDSIINAINDQVKQFGIGFASSSILFHDFATKILKVENLWDLYLQGEETAIQNRVNDMVASMSNQGILVVDMKDEFNKIQTPITGLPELLDKFMELVSAASNIPKTILFGQQIGKLAGAEVTLTNYYDYIKSYQKERIERPVQQLVNYILRTKEINAPQNVLDEWSMAFKPLWQLSDDEIAKTRKTMAETDQIYINNGILSPQEVADSRFGGDEYSIETTIDGEARAGLQEISEQEDRDFLEENNVSETNVGNDQD